MIQPSQVAAIVVTRDRPILLREVIAALLQQSLPLGKIIIVDNASGAPTQELLTEFQHQCAILRLEQNTGGTGGFTHGLVFAQSFSEIEYFWLMDDDAVPEKCALEKLIDAESLIKSKQSIGALCSAVIEFGELALMHRRKFNPKNLDESVIPLSDYQNPIVEIDTGSFVSFLVYRKAIEKCGLPDLSFFSGL
ncbi:glycosyltransferase [Dickeya oryzae]